MKKHNQENQHFLPQRNKCTLLALKLLVNTGLVESYRGAAGGYSLLRSAEDISVAEIIEAIEGPIAMTECSIEEGLCAQESKCGLRGNWQRISLAISQAMSNVSLAEMANPEKPLIGQPSLLRPSTLKPSLLKITTLNITT